MAGISDIRPSPIAGMWYTADPKRLAQEVDDYISTAHLPALEDKVIGVVAPHAGHRYSGSTAGYAFRTVKGCSFDVVAVISPMHGYHPAGLLTSAHRFYSTPLGNIPVAADLVDALARLLLDRTGVELTSIANDGEHSLEIELPFLQRALTGSFDLLPIMVRTQAPAVLEALGKALAEVLKPRKALLVASTDLSHFYPEMVARRLDSGMLEAIGSFDPGAVLEAEASGKGYACGAPAVAAAMWAARELGADKVKVLHHSTSGDETGDRSQVVGYGAAVILKSA